jgi:hypothetical protein
VRLLSLLLILFSTNIWGDWQAADEYVNNTVTIAALLLLGSTSFRQVKEV